MKNYLKAVGLGVLCTFGLSSCGVMFGGSNYYAHVIVNDHPEATILVNGEKIGTGKANVLYPRKESFEVEITQEGCEPIQQTYFNEFRTGNFVLSVVTWGLLGLGVDLGTGASYRPDLDRYPTVTKRLDMNNYAYFIDYPNCPVE